MVAREDRGLAQVVPVEIRRAVGLRIYFGGKT